MPEDDLITSLRDTASMLVEIRALRAENRRLREALQSVAAALYTHPHTEWGYHERLAYDAVRAALANEKEQPDVKE